MGLGEPGDRGDQRHAVRVRGPEVPGEVDRAEEHAGARVVDRRGRARPAVEQAVEVLGGEDLQRVVEVQRRCRSALVPAAFSLSSAPGTKWFAAAASSISGWPSADSSIPCASLMTTMWRASRATPPSIARTIGTISPSRWEASRAAASRSLMSRGAGRVGSTPRPLLRSHESRTISRTIPGRPRPLRTASCARRSSRARSSGSASTDGAEPAARPSPRGARSDGRASTCRRHRPPPSRRPTTPNCHDPRAANTTGRRSARRRGRPEPAWAPRFARSTQSAARRPARICCESVCRARRLLPSMQPPERVDGRDRIP